MNKNIYNINPYNGKRKLRKNEVQIEYEKNKQSIRNEIVRLLSKVSYLHQNHYKYKNIDGVIIIGSRQEVDEAYENDLEFLFQKELKKT